MSASGPQGPAKAGHLWRIGLLTATAAVLLGGLAARTDILFADGLRYIAQAQAYHDGFTLSAGVDHPLYPLGIVATRAVLGGDRPEDWQIAAQGASILAGVLLVVPIYLISRDLFGDDRAALATLLVYLVPLTGHVFADTLSESLFLLFWSWGLWAALRFLGDGSARWAPVVAGFSALAYLTRPEGLLLPAAVVATLGLCPVWFARSLGRRGLWAIGALLIGLAAVVGPYVAIRGGLGTKPSIQRLLGTAPKSAAQAVERQRPLEPGQSETLTYVLAGKAVFKAVVDSTTWPLLPFAALGVAAALIRARGGASRRWRLLAVIGGASVLALLRLHATGGYCSPRHALILALILIPASAFGFDRLLIRAAGLRPGGRVPVRGLGWALAIAALAAIHGPDLLAPVNPGMDGYRQAGHWLADHADAGGKVVDVTGWSQFYGRRDGYTFENLVAAPADPSARWVVVREAHLRGPWEYCRRLRALVEGLEPVEVFRGSARRRSTRVYVFDRLTLIARPRGPGSSAESATLRR